jgi:hypothetical protein
MSGWVILDRNGLSARCPVYPPSDRIADIADGPFRAKRRSGAFRARSAKSTIPSLDHGAVDEVLEQMSALHAGRGTLCQLDGDQFFFGVYGEAGSEYAAPHCIAL